MLCFFGAIRVANAGENISALEALQVTAPQVGLSNVPVAKNATDPGKLPIVIDWTVDFDYTWQFDGEHGTFEFDYSGKKYGLKLLFERGEYDLYVKQYKPLTAFAFIAYEGEGRNTIWDIMRLYKGPGYAFLPDKTFFKITLQGEDVQIYKCRNESDPGELVTSVPCDMLRDLWAKKWAPGGYRELEGKRVFFAAQNFWDGQNKVIRSGYVLCRDEDSTGEIYNPNTGLPLDFVELFKGTGKNRDYKPFAYSVAMSLKFRHFVEDGRHKWEVTRLLVSDMQDALDDELKQ